MPRFLFDPPLAVRVLVRSCVAYAIGIAALTAVSTWGAIGVGSAFLRAVEQHIIDGSGQLQPETATALPQLSLLPAINVAVSLEPAARPADDPAPSKVMPVPAGLVHPLSDNPDTDPAAAFHGGSETTYRTYCVRLCDGYFWPISFSATSGHFDQDEAACTSSCNSPARLFVHRMPGGGPGTMVSLSGVPYSALKTAFMFRTRYDAQCTCRAQPWQQAARDQHRLYAAQASVAEGIPGAQATVRLLEGRLAANQKVEVAAKTQAREQSDRELQALAKSTRARPLARTAARDAQESRSRRRDRFARANSDSEGGSAMRLGGIAGSSEGSGHSRWNPASGMGLAWQVRVFNGN